ncbi:MAG: hypothetical protein AVDCRST_MAG05-5044, partial [uncultured Rubrobacteraceae bacterium]
AVGSRRSGDGRRGPRVPGAFGGAARRAVRGHPRVWPVFGLVVLGSV